MANETYEGKVTPIGNSKGIRFNSGLFRAHPEFTGYIKAQVIGDGVMLVSTQTTEETGNNSEDPVMNAFLQFLAKDMMAHPEHIQPIEKNELDEIADLIKGVNID